MAAPNRRGPGGCGRAGFTLIELLAVLAILATLLTIALPRYFKSVEQAKEAVLRENLRVVRQTIDKFQGDQNRYPDSLQELVERGYLMAVPMDPITESASTWELIAPAEAAPGQVRDIKSGAPGQASNGQAFGDW